MQCQIKMSFECKLTLTLLRELDTYNNSPILLSTKQFTITYFFTSKSSFNNNL